MAYQLAQINVGKMKGVDIDDPIMKEFVDNLDYVNGLAEQHPGFVWRLQDDENNATSFNPYNNVSIIINISVWKDVATLKSFVYNSPHFEFVKRRREWFEKFATHHFAMWWIESGRFPTVEEATEKLKLLEANGNAPEVFDFRQTFPPPDSPTII